MAKDNDDSLEFDFNDLDLSEFDLDFNVNEDDFKEEDSVDSAQKKAEEKKESEPIEKEEKTDIAGIEEALLGGMSEESVHTEENSSEAASDVSNDFDDLFSLLGMGDVNEQEIFSSMMDSIPDSDEENKDTDFAEDEEVEEVAEDRKKTTGSSMNDIYSDVLGAVGALEDKEAEEQLLSELEGIEDRTDSKKKSKKNKKAKKDKKQPKEKKDVSVLLFGEEEPETEEEKLAREKKEAEKASKKEAKNQKKEEKKKLAEEKKKQAKEQAKLKKAKELENMDPEDLKPVNKTALLISVCVFLCIALFIILGTTIFHYALTIRKASDYFDRKKYDMAYEEIIGVEVKEDDEELRDKIYTVMYVERAYLSYNIYVDMGSYEKALNMLLSGLEKYDEYYPQGMALGIEEDMDYCRNKIVNALYDDYGMNLNDAYEMIALDDTEYQIQIIEKSKEFKSKK
ncbi:MAG: hypothetical protein IJA32_02055 [Lachnospiraceae bacterium]|nr:hypothetical protein [Lachnospiraceae bacterium]